MTTELIAQARRLHSLANREGAGAHGLQLINMVRELADEVEQLQAALERKGGEVVAWLQITRSAEGGELDEELVWGKDEELADVLYEYRPLVFGDDITQPQQAAQRKGGEVGPCPRCGVPASNLFAATMPGDQLDTVHCGCLYTQPQQAADAGEASAPTKEWIKAVLTAAYRDGRLSWLGFERGDDGFYSIPSLSESHYQAAFAVAAALSSQPPATAQREPLTDGQVLSVIHSIDPGEQHLSKALAQFARAIEAAHGITAPAGGEVSNADQA